MAGFARKGVLPVSGGALEQADSFMDALEWIEHEEAFWRSRLRSAPEGD